MEKPTFEIQKVTFESEGWKSRLMDEFCVTFERAEDDTVVERLETFITTELQKAREEWMNEPMTKEMWEQRCNEWRLQTLTEVMGKVKDMKEMFEPAYEPQDVAYTQALSDIKDLLENLIKKTV